MHLKSITNSTLDLYKRYSIVLLLVLANTKEEKYKIEYLIRKR